MLDDYDNFIERGKRARDRLKQQAEDKLEYFIDLGLALVAGKDKLRQETGVNGFDPGSRGFQIYKEWLLEVEFTEYTAKEREALERICDPRHIKPIREWYAKLSGREKNSISNPIQVWVRCQRVFGGATPKHGLTLILLSLKANGAKNPHVHDEQKLSTAEYIQFVVSILQTIAKWDNIDIIETIDMIRNEIESREDLPRGRL